MNLIDWLGYPVCALPKLGMSKAILVSEVNANRCKKFRMQFLPKDFDSDEQFAAIPNQRTRFTGVREDDRPQTGLGPSL